MRESADDIPPPRFRANIIQPSLPHRQPTIGITTGPILHTFSPGIRGLGPYPASPFNPSPSITKGTFRNGPVPHSRPRDHREYGIAYLPRVFPHPDLGERFAMRMLVGRRRWPLNDHGRIVQFTVGSLRSGSRTHRRHSASAPQMRLPTRRASLSIQVERGAAQNRRAGTELEFPVPPTFESVFHAASFD